MNHLTLLILLAFSMNTNGQNKTEEELLEELKTRMSLSEILGKYKESPTIKKLNELNANEEFDMGSLSCFLEYGKPYVPAPTDIVPFGYTGGDGCYFAFLTDFGFYDNLDDCPIVFISPTDFDSKQPQNANKIIARNIFDFLTILTQIRYAEITRFEELKTLDFASKIKEFINDSSEETIKIQNSTINLINANFNLPLILNLNQYYADLEKERNGQNYLKLKDNLNLKFASYSTTNILDSILTHKDLEIWLNKNDKYSKLAFYREAPYVYQHFKDDYNNIQKLIVEQMEKDGIVRESKILRFEIEQNQISEKWLELRRQNLKNER
jgi:hypothetical protein